MVHMDALFQYWADPDHCIIPAGQTDRIIAWLEQQTPDTWHKVVMNWNYDHGDAVLSWILTQPACDKGTAARVFRIEGLGHWLAEVLADPAKADDTTHVCRIVLDNWHRYSAGELSPGAEEVPDWLQKRLAENAGADIVANTPLHAVLAYKGTRDAVSEFASEDGKIVVDFDHWAKANGIVTDG